MKRILSIIGIIFLTAGIAFGVMNWTDTTVSVTSTNTATTLHQFSELTIRNAGTNEIYCDVGDSVATTSNFYIEAGEIYTTTISGTTVNLICDTSETSTAIIRGGY